MWSDVFGREVNFLDVCFVFRRLEIDQHVCIVEVEVIHATSRFTSSLHYLMKMFFGLTPSKYQSEFMVPRILNLRVLTTVNVFSDPTIHVSEH